MICSPLEYNAMISFLETRIKINKDNDVIVRRLDNIINDIKALKELDKEKPKAINNFTDDYD